MESKIPRKAEKMATRFSKMQLGRFTSNAMSKASPDHKSQASSPVDTTPDVSQLISLFPLKLFQTFSLYSPIQSPVKATLYASLDKSSQPKSIAIVTHQKQKKLRHRRNGSGGGYVIPQASPIRDRRYQSESENRKIKLVDMQTQTDTMDISETDASPSAFAASRELSMCLRDNSTELGGGMIDSAIVNEEYTLRDENNSPNGNLMSRSDITYQDACSSPDQLDDADAMNSNERLNIRDCSDDDNLEQLGRKVSQFINRLSIQSNHSENGNNMVDGGLTFDTTAGRRVFLSLNNENEVTSIRCGGSYKKTNYKPKDDQCDDSWTDEEGENTDNDCSLKRRW